MTSGGNRWPAYEGWADGVMPAPIAVSPPAGNLTRPNLTVPYRGSAGCDQRPVLRQISPPSAAGERNGAARQPTLEPCLELGEHRDDHVMFRYAADAGDPFRRDPQRLLLFRRLIRGNP